MLSALIDDTQADAQQAGARRAKMRAAALRVRRAFVGPAAARRADYYSIGQIRPMRAPPCSGAILIRG